MKVLGLISSAVLGAGLLAGCNSGDSGRTTPKYGPGTTGVPATAGSGGGSTSSGNIGTFSQGPPMAFARVEHTATPFPSVGAYTQGGVLVVGGHDGQNNLYPDSEVYDTAKGTWSKTSVLNAAAGLMKNGKVANSPTTARRNHIALLLNTGKILVTGGQGNDGTGQPVLRTSFLFDPGTNGFTQTDDMPVGRFMAQGIVLATGKALVCTGLEATGQTSRSADLFDPATSKWAGVGGAVGGAVLDAHFGAVMIGLGNKALVCSGANVAQQQGKLQLAAPPFPQTKVEQYDSATDKFTPGPALSEDRVFFAAVTLAQGDAFLVGGQGLSQTGGSQILDTITRFDRPGGKFVASGGLNKARSSALASEVGGGKTGNFVVTGGIDAQGAPTDTAEVWQFKINGVSKTPTSAPAGMIKMKAARTSHAQAQLTNGQLLVTGGYDATGAPQKTTEIYKD